MQLGSFRLRNPFYRPSTSRRVYTDKDVPAHEWFEWWTKEELQAWVDEHHDAWLKRPGHPDFAVGLGAIPPQENEYAIKRPYDLERA
jgi:hypothetical protein